MISKKLFTKEECDTIIALTQTYDRGKHKNSTYSFDEQSRVNAEDKVFYTGYIIPVNNETSWVYEKLFNFFEKESKFKLYRYPTGFYIMQYKVGDKFMKHNDSAFQRVFTVGVQLNSEYTGGEFTVEDNGKEIKLSKEPGTSYFFEVACEHEVKEITSGVRYSIVSFIKEADLLIADRKNLI